jgi:hypothetical protein
MYVHIDHYPSPLDGNQRSVAEALRPKDYAALNNPRTRDSKETLRRRAIRLAMRVQMLEAALKKIVAMEEVSGSSVPTFVDRTGAIAEARLVLAGEPFWDADLK